MNTGWYTSILTNFCSRFEYIDDVGPPSVMYFSPQEVSSFCIEKKRRFFVDNLKFGVQLADVLTRCSSHPQGISEARCENARAL